MSSVSVFLGGSRVMWVAVLVGRIVVLYPFQLQREDGIVVRIDLPRRVYVPECVLYRECMYTSAFVSVHVVLFPGMAVVS